MSRDLAGLPAAAPAGGRVTLTWYRIVGTERQVVARLREHLDDGQLEAASRVRPVPLVSGQFYAYAQLTVPVDPAPTPRRAVVRWTVAVAAAVTVVVAAFVGLSHLLGPALRASVGSASTVLGALVIVFLARRATRGGGKHCPGCRD